MYKQTDKAINSKSNIITNSVTQKKNNETQGFKFVDNRPNAVMQQKRQEIGNASFMQQQTIQKKENNTGLPDDLKSGIENLSGYSMDDVKVHYNSSKPVQLNAHAYAQGSDIHLSSGQEKHLPHEAWHVVQQKQGRVQPTMQMKDMVNVNDDHRLEKEADVMGEKALQMHSASSNINLQQINLNNKVTAQRYLIVGDRDFTREFREGADIDTTTDTVFDAMENILNQGNDYEQEVYNFIHANANGKVKRQIKKWIEDDQGRARLDLKGIPAFGRKQQGRSYSNMTDAAKAIYGWVSAKPRRHREKELAVNVYANPVIEIQINAVFTKIRQWIAGQGNAAAIENELAVDNPALPRWDDYRRYFNRGANAAALNQPIPGRFLSVLDNPATFSMRDKIAVLHDLMKYFQAGAATQGGNMLNDGMIPTMRATIRTGGLSRGISSYDRPRGSHIPRDAINRGLVPANLPAERIASRLEDSQEETHNSFKFARQNQIPMWGRHSFTAARMMQMVKEAGGDKGEISSVAWAIMAFWRQNYDHRQIPYHTLHEIMDFTPAFGLTYDPLNPENGLDDLNVAKQLVDTLIIKAGLSAWSGEIDGMFNRRPVGVGLIRTEVNSAHNLNNKLINIKRIVTPLAQNIGVYSPKTEVFYQILNIIPANINLYQVIGTPVGTNTVIENNLRSVFTGIKRFTLP